jgi:hypothetical protein
LTSRLLSSHGGPFVAARQVAIRMDVSSKYPSGPTYQP